MDKEMLKQLKYYLPVSWAERVADKTKYSISYVRRVGNGHVYCEPIIREMVRLAKANKAMHERIQKEIIEITKTSQEN